VVAWIFTFTPLHYLIESKISLLSKHVAMIYTCLEQMPKQYLFKETTKVPLSCMRKEKARDSFCEVK
jgi:hypothetical protein